MITNITSVCPIRFRSNEARLLLGGKLVRIYIGERTTQLRSIMHVRHNIPSDPKLVPGRLQIDGIPKSGIQKQFLSGIHSGGPVFPVSPRADSFRSYPGLGQVLVQIPFAFKKYNDVVSLDLTNKWGYSIFNRTTHAISLVCNPRYIQSLPSYVAGRLYARNPRALGLIIFKGRQLLL